LKRAQYCGGAKVRYEDYSCNREVTEPLNRDRVFLTLTYLVTDTSNTVQYRVGTYILGVWKNGAGDESPKLDTHAIVFIKYF